LSSRNPVVQVVLFAAISGHVFVNTGLRQCELNLNLCRLMLKTGFEMAGGDKRIQSAIIDDIPRTIGTVLRQFNLNPPSIILAICPNVKCQAVYRPTIVSSEIPPYYPPKCSHRRHPVEDVCGTSLLQVSSQGVPVPMRPMPFWHFEEYLGMLFSRADFEEAIDRFADDACRSAASPRPDNWTHIYHGEFLRSFKGPDNNELFLKRNGTEARVVFALFFDGFNLERNTLGGESRSWGMIAIKCVSLPIEWQNRHDNFFIPFIIPPYKGEPSQDVIDHYLGLITDVFLRGWETGIRLTKTATQKGGRNVRFALVYALGDLKARVKVAGVQDHTAHRCGGICDCEGPDTHRRFDHAAWNGLTLQEMKRRAKLWREASSAKAREKAFKEHGVRDSVMYRLPYWNPTRQVVVDPMHILKNLADFMCGEVLNITENPPKVSTVMDIGHDFLLPDVAFEENRYTDIVGSLPADRRDKFCSQVIYIHKTLRQGTEDNGSRKEFLTRCWNSIKRCQSAPLAFVLSTLDLRPIATQPWMEDDALVNENMTIWEEESSGSSSEGSGRSSSESSTQRSQVKPTCANMASALIHWVSTSDSCMLVAHSMFSAPSSRYYFLLVLRQQATSSSKLASEGSSRTLSSRLGFRSRLLASANQALAASRHRNGGIYSLCIFLLL
jgi:hypothetical protein